MARLAPHCRKNVLTTMACAKEANRLAALACAKESGRGKGACLDANYENYLAQLCAEIVCPNDPNRLVGAVIATTAQTTVLNADQGGGFDKAMDQFNIQSGGGTAPDNGSSGGTDPQKMKMYLLCGLAVAAVVVFGMSRRD